MDNDQTERSMGTRTIVAIIVISLLLIGAIWFAAGKAPNPSEGTAQTETPSNGEGAPTGETPTIGTQGDYAPDSSAAGGTVEAGASAGVTVGAADAPVKEFRIEGGMYYFNPSEIKVKKGDDVRIVFTNKEGTHDWAIDEFNARTPIIKTGQTETVEFVADKAGRFEYYCSVGNHRAMGMKGTLVVE